MTWRPFAYRRALSYQSGVSRHEIWHVKFDNKVETVQSFRGGIDIQDTVQTGAAV